MKKIVIVIIIVLVLELVALGLIYTLIQDGNYKIFKGKDYAFGLAFIGGLTEDYDYSVVNTIYNNKEFEVVSLGGTERYLIIPNKTKLDIYHVKFSEQQETTYVTSMIQPFYLDCNPSDIFPNSILKFSKNGEEYEYSPSISLKDGSISTPDFVLYIK